MTNNKSIWHSIDELPAIGKSVVYKDDWNFTGKSDWAYADDLIACAQELETLRKASNQNGKLAESNYNEVLDLRGKIEKAIEFLNEALRATDRPMSMKSWNAINYAIKTLEGE